MKVTNHAGDSQRRHFDEKPNKAAAAAFSAARFRPPVCLVPRGSRGSARSLDVVYRVHVVGSVETGVLSYSLTCSTLDTDRCEPRVCGSTKNTTKYQNSRSPNRPHLNWLAPLGALRRGTSVELEDQLFSRTPDVGRDTVSVPASVLAESPHVAHLPTLERSGV